MTCDPDKILEAAFFPVALTTVYMKTGYAPESGDDKIHTFHKLKRFKAIQSQDTPGKVTFAIVSPSYRLVTNEQAYNMGRSLFGKVFENIGEKDLQPMNLIMPKTRSYCHLDLMHQAYNVSVFPGDNWIPFLRITNSYNRSYALGFTMGFCRGICSNGIIFSEKSVKFKYTHSRAAQNAQNDFVFKRDSLVQMEKSFIDNLKNLHKVRFPRPLIWPLVCKVFEIRPPGGSPGGKNFKGFYAAKSHILELSNRYFRELGDNCYAVLNILTDYASRPDGLYSSSVQTHSLQRKSGIWARGFLQEVTKPAFSFESYLDEYIDLPARLK